jgi:hypothetical protein
MAREAQTADAFLPQQGDGGFCLYCAGRRADICRVSRAAEWRL